MALRLPSIWLRYAEKVLTAELTVNKSLPPRNPAKRSAGLDGEPHSASRWRPAFGLALQLRWVSIIAHTLRHRQARENFRPQRLIRRNAQAFQHPHQLPRRLPRMPNRAFHKFMHGLFAVIDISARRPIPSAARPIKPIRHAPAHFLAIGDQLFPRRVLFFRDAHIAIEGQRNAVFMFQKRIRGMALRHHQPKPAMAHILAWHISEPQQHNQPEQRHQHAAGTERQCPSSRSKSWPSSAGPRIAGFPQGKPSPTPGRMNTPKGERRGSSQTHQHQQKRSTEPDHHRPLQAEAQTLRNRGRHSRKQ